jgi:hypothetical protein
MQQLARAALFIALDRPSSRRWHAIAPGASELPLHGAVPDI